MHYESGAAFRRALEDRLRQQAVTSGTSLARRSITPQAMRRFLAPLLSGFCGEVWDPIDWEWK